MYAKYVLAKTRDWGNKRLDENDQDESDIRVGIACCIYCIPGGDELKRSGSGSDAATVPRAKMTMQRADVILESGPVSQN